MHVLAGFSGQGRSEPVPDFNLQLWRLPLMRNLLGWSVVVDRSSQVKPEGSKLPLPPTRMPRACHWPGCNVTLMPWLRKAKRAKLDLPGNLASSLTWQTKFADAWMRLFTPYLANVAACAHGMNALKH